jgi:hypothetical protein
MFIVALFPIDHQILTQVRFIHRGVIITGIQWMMVPWWVLVHSGPLGTYTPLHTNSSRVRVRVRVS